MNKQKKQRGGKREWQKEGQKREARIIENRDEREENETQRKKELRYM
jgi:hypothetical protein